jgi:hypothetical protein
MPNEVKFDKFKPQQPTIPGVSPGAANPAVTRIGTTSPQAGAWIIVGIVLVVSIVGGTFYKIRRASGIAKASVTDAPAMVAPIAGAVSKPLEHLAWGPGPVATTEEMTKTWSSQRFMFRDPVTNQPLPAIVVRLPGGAYWGFSLREPFGDCDLEYVTDLERLWNKYQFKADHPMVIDPCNQTVYDLLKYGAGASNDALVRGEIVQGSGIRPPMAIEIRRQGKQIVAVRRE